MLYSSAVSSVAYVSHYDLITQVLGHGTTPQPGPLDGDKKTSLSVASEEPPELTEVKYDLAELNYFVLHPVLTITYLVIMVLSTIIGNIGNMLVISAVCTYQKLRSKANVFIINLAIADYCISFFVQGFSIVALVKGYGFFAERIWLCDAIATICLISCSCSTWNMAAIALNRYIVLCHHNMYQKIFSWRNTVLIAISLWLICGLLEMPNHFSWGGHAFDPKTIACSYDRTAMYSYTVFFVSVAISSPLLVIFACYVGIFFYVRKSRQTVQKHGTTSTGKARGSFTPRELRLAKTLFIIFVVFLIFWAPYAIVVLVDIHDKWPKVVYVVVMQMAHTNSSLNSIIYAATNKDFRKGYYLFITQRLLYCCMCGAVEIRNKYNGSKRSSRTFSDVSISMNTNVPTTLSNSPTGSKSSLNK